MKPQQRFISCRCNRRSRASGGDSFRPLGLLVRETTGFDSEIVRGIRNAILDMAGVLP